MLTTLPENLMTMLEHVVNASIRQYLNSNVRSCLSTDNNNHILTNEEIYEIQMIFADCEAELLKVENEGVCVTMDGDNVLTGRYTVWSLMEKFRLTPTETVFHENRQLLIEWAQQHIEFPYGNPLDQEFNQPIRMEVLALVWLAFLETNLNFVREKYEVNKIDILARYNIIA